MQIKTEVRAAFRLVAESNSDVIAPATDFKSQNEKQLEHQQDTRETTENKESTSTSPKSAMDKTAVKDTGTDTTASSTPVSKNPTTQQTDAQYAHAQAYLKIKAALRLFRIESGAEDDPLTMDMENAALEESTRRPNTKQRPVARAELKLKSKVKSKVKPRIANSTVDTDGMPGLFDGYQMIGEEGDNQSYAKQKKGQKQLEAGPPSTSKSDGFMYESLPGVLNEDQEANMTREQVLEHEVLSDADPRLFNMGQQPLG